MNSAFNIKRALAIARKERFHILREPFTFTLAAILPVILVFIFGLSIEFNVKNIEVTVHDSDKTTSSRKVIETFTSSDYFTLKRTTQNIVNTIKDLDSNKVKATIIIPPDFEKNLTASKTSELQFILDGSDNSTAGMILGYLIGLQKATIVKVTGAPIQSLIQIESRYLFNPELQSPWFVVPGLAVVITAVLSILLTALTVAREWETGSMELLLSTPVKPLEIIVGKLIPYTIIGMSSVLFVVLTAIFGFKIPFSGSFIFYGAGTFFFLLACLSQGILISIVIRNQQLAMQAAMVTGLLPSFLLSGFVFPVESMPSAIQNITSILSAKWFMIYSRGVFSKGANLFDLRISFLSLAFIGTALILVAAKKFKKDLEP